MKPIADVKKFGMNFIKDDCDALIFGWWSSYLDSYEYLTIFENSDANFSGIYDANLSSRIIKSQDISNMNDRYNEYQAMIKKIAGLCVIKPLFTKHAQTIYVRKNINPKGIGLVAFPHYYLGNVVKEGFV